MVELFHDWDAVCCIKVRFCLAEKGVPWAGRLVNLEASENRKPAYLALNPDGLVPALRHGGHVITESSVINEFINEEFPGPALAPSNAVERAQMRMWVKFQDDVLHPALRGPAYEMMLRDAFGRMPKAAVDERIALARHRRKADRLRRAANAPAPDGAKVEASRRALARALEKMEDRLSRAPWLGGEEFSLADIAAAPFIDRFDELQAAGAWSNTPALASWMKRVKARPAYLEALPEAAELLAPHLNRG